MRISTLFSPLLNFPRAASPSCMPNRSTIFSLNSGCEDPPVHSQPFSSNTEHTEDFALPHSCSYIMMKYRLGICPFVEGNMSLGRPRFFGLRNYWWGTPVAKFILEILILTVIGAEESRSHDSHHPIANFAGKLKLE